MKVLQTAISRAGYREKKGNHTRLNLFSKILEYARQRSVTFVMLPAGFLYTAKTDEVPAILDELKSRAAAVGGVGAIGGVDASRRTKSALDSRVKRGHPLPFTGFVIEPGGSTLHKWQQKTFLSIHASPQNAIDIADRTICFQNKRILFLICGEMFNHHTRSALVGRGLDLIVDAGHDGLGTGLIRTLKALARNAGCAALFSQHLKGMGRLHMVRADGQQESVRVSDHMVFPPKDGLWAAAVERSI